MESNSKTGGLRGIGGKALVTVLKPSDKSKDLFMRMIQKMMKPYIDEAFEKLNSKKMIASPRSHRESIDNTQKLLLEAFWQMSQTDAQISMMMVPVMAFLKKKDREAAESANRS